MARPELSSPADQPNSSVATSAIVLFVVVLLVVYSSWQRQRAEQGVTAAQLEDLVSRSYAQVNAAPALSPEQALAHSNAVLGGQEQVFIEPNESSPR